LIIIGGIGFFVWGDVVKYKFHLKKYSFHSKIVLSTTGILIIGGWILFAIFEWNNPATIGNYGAGTKILASLFMSVSPRTAGFNTVEMASLTNGGNLLTICLMFIGGSPGSTAGGAKTTTIAVIVLSAIASAKRYSETHIFCRKFEDDAYPNAGVVISLYFALIIVCVLAICGIENAAGYSLTEILFEVVSAVATVGLSHGITANLHVVSKLILIALMFIGRVGGFTLILVFSSEKQPVTISRIAEKLIIG
jgi:trk system potassium uptake protein TrkH